MIRRCQGADCRGRAATPTLSIRRRKPCEDFVASPKIDRRRIYVRMGRALALCHEIEHHLAHSVILSLPDPKAVKTIAEFIDIRKKRTAGRLLHSINTRYDIDPVFREGFDAFLDMRNRLVHGLTLERRYRIDSVDGLTQLSGFLDAFFMIAVPLRNTFRGTSIASVDFLSYIVKKETGKAPIKLSKWERDQLGFFFDVFKLKKGAREVPNVRDLRRQLTAPPRTAGSTFGAVGGRPKGTPT
jgi:hypothetical protein